MRCLVASIDRSIFLFPSWRSTVDLCFTGLWLPIPVSSKASDLYQKIIPPFLFVSFLLWLACMKRTLYCDLSLIPIHPSIHFTNIGRVLHRFLSFYIFIEYSAPIPPSSLPIPYNLRRITQLGCKCLCMKPLALQVWEQQNAYNGHLLSR